MREGETSSRASNGKRSVEAEDSTRGDRLALVLRFADFEEDPAGDRSDCLRARTARTARKTAQTAVESTSYLTSPKPHRPTNLDWHSLTAWVLPRPQLSFGTGAAGSNGRQSEKRV